MTNSAEVENRPSQMEKVVDISLKVMTALVIPLLLWVNALSVRLAVMDENNKRMSEELRAMKEEARSRDAQITEMRASMGEIKTTLVFVREKVKEIADAINTHR